MNFSQCLSETNALSGHSKAFSLAPEGNIINPELIIAKIKLCAVLNPVGKEEAKVKIVLLG